MGFEQRKQERQALVQHLLAQDWNVFGTLKFVNGRTIGRHSANKLLRSYWNKVDRVIYGKAAERQNMRVPRWCFAHEGADNENFHVHFVMPSPLQDTEHMCCLLNAVWAQHHAQTAPLAKNWIMPVQDRAAVTSYVTHEYWRMGSDTISDNLVGMQSSQPCAQRQLHPTTGTSYYTGSQPTLATAGTTGIKHTTGTI